MPLIYIKNKAASVFLQDAYFRFVKLFTGIKKYFEMCFIIVT